MTTFAISVPEPWNSLVRLAYEHGNLLSAKEAARLLGCSVDALRKKVQRAQLPRGAVVHTGKRAYRLRRDKLLPA